MRQRVLWFLNGAVAFVTASFLFIRFTASPIPAPFMQNLPGPAASTQQATHLAFVTYSYPVEGEPLVDALDSMVSLLAYPLDANGRVSITESPELLFSQPTPASCEIDGIHPSPNHLYLFIEYNCEADQFIHLLTLIDEPRQVTTIERAYFLDWSSDGNWFLFRQIDEDQIWLASTDGSNHLLLDLPVGTYEATFIPDSQSILYAANAGLGMGSEMGVLNLANGRQPTWQQLPHHIIVYPRWSPDGSQLTYILMPDSNIPYTIGELWLADATGQPVTFLDEVDAGHGYPPVWSPNGQSIIYVHRENPDSLLANYLPHALQSNIYQVEVSNGAITPLTHFGKSHVSHAVWSSDGRQLAFTVNEAIWLLTPGLGEPIKVSQINIARYPVWLVMD